MSVKCGIVGLPNVGKSTTFNALTKAGAKVENYPFCTIDPNTGIVEVGDERLVGIMKYIPAKKVIPAVMEFVDIAGLVKGASQGEGLGNKFLGHIREVTVIVHVVRCFENDDIIHVEGSVDALRDIETIEMELAISDLESLERRIKSLGKQERSGDKEAGEIIRVATLLEKELSDGTPARLVELSEEDKLLAETLRLITMKPVLYCCNVNEDDAASGNAEVDRVRKFAEERNSATIHLCAEMEAEIAVLESVEERQEFLDSLGLKKSGLEVLAQKGYDLLGLRTYFTAGEKEIRAWTIHKGDAAPQAAGVIHSDFERGFIRAEVYHYEDLLEFHSEKTIRDSGKLRVEGKDYIVQDGDIMNFLFNV